MESLPPFPFQDSAEVLQSWRKGWILLFEADTCFNSRMKGSAVLPCPGRGPLSVSSLVLWIISKVHLDARHWVRCWGQEEDLHFPDFPLSSSLVSLRVSSLLLAFCGSILESSASGQKHLFSRHTVSRGEGWKPAFQDIGPLYCSLFQRQTHKGGVNMKITSPRLGRADCPREHRGPFSMVIQVQLAPGSTSHLSGARVSPVDFHMYPCVKRRLVPRSDDCLVFPLAANFSQR